LKVGLTPSVEDDPQIDSVKLQTVEDDLAAQAEREWVADSKRGSGMVNRGDELAGLPIEEFYVAKRDCAGAELRFDSSDLGAQPVGFERFFDLDREKAIEPFRAEIEQDGENDESYQAKRRIHKQPSPRGAVWRRRQIFPPGAHQ
jgi:hypothetical protein